VTGRSFSLGNSGPGVSNRSILFLILTIYFGAGRGCFHLRRPQMSSLFPASATFLLKKVVRARFIVRYHTALSASVLEARKACFVSEQAWFHQPSLFLDCTRTACVSKASESFEKRPGRSSKCRHPSKQVESHWKPVPIGAGTG
jgi:hypothetical protein